MESYYVLGFCTYDLLMLIKESSLSKLIYILGFGNKIWSLVKQY